MAYSIQEESKRILTSLLNSLPIPSDVADAAQTVTFSGTDSQPVIPSPCKMTEACSALTGLLAAAAAAVASDRYGVRPSIAVDTDLATLFLESIILANVNGTPAHMHPTIRGHFAAGDLYQINKPIHQEATNVYKTRDGKFYHLHGSMNAGPTMTMLGVDEQDCTLDEAISIYAAKVAQHDAAELEARANDEFRQAGVTCLTTDEFFASEQGKIMASEQLWTTRSIDAPQSKWPTAKGTRPLEGIRVIDFSRVIAAPVISKMLALLGADVIKVSSDHLPDLALTWIDLSTGKRDTNINLKTDEGRRAFTELVAGADVLVNGYRPGVLDRLGFPASVLREINKTLIYARENCYGFKGPLAHRSGWQQISDCHVGVSWLQGEFLGLNEPVVPLLPNSDYQTGLVGAIAIVIALLQRTKEDKTFDVDVSLTQFNIWYVRQGTYDADTAAALRARHEGFSVRHWDEMQSLVAKTHAALNKARPELFQRPDYFWKMSGNEWGIDEEISVLKPAFNLEGVELGYKVPSGRRGRHEPVWIAGA